jgi:hypothetical protein
VRALREMADAIGAERAMSGATVEVGRAALVATLRERIGASPELARYLATIQEGNPMSAPLGRGPGASLTRNAGPVFRAAYLIRAAQRLRGADDPAAQKDQENRHFRQHQAAQTARELGAMRLDAAQAAYGRTLGWYAQDDARTTPECRAADGKNFDVRHPPAIGLPGVGPHHGCRCTPGAPHAGAAFLAAGTAPDTLPGTTRTTEREPIVAVSRNPGTAVELVSGDTSPLSTSTTSNWVARRGGLPGRVRAIARAIKRRNPSWPLSRCIAVAINMVKWSAATGDVKGFPGRQNERPDTVAAHAAAAAHWEAMKGSAGGPRRSRSKAKALAAEIGLQAALDLAMVVAETRGRILDFAAEIGTPAAIELAGKPVYRYRHGWIPLAGAEISATHRRHADAIAAKDAKGAKAHARSLSDHDLRGVDAEMTRRAARRGKPGHTTANHRAVKAEVARRGGVKDLKAAQDARIRSATKERTAADIAETRRQRAIWERRPSRTVSQATPTELAVQTGSTPVRSAGDGPRVTENAAAPSNWDTAEQRRRWARSGVAMSDGSFPIPNVAFLRKAISAYGRAGNKPKAKAHIIKRARALGATNLLPEGWS